MPYAYGRSKSYKPARIKKTARRSAGRGSGGSSKKKIHRTSGFGSTNTSGDKKVVWNKAKAAPNAASGNWRSGTSSKSTWSPSRNHNVAGNSMNKINPAGVGSKVVLGDHARQIYGDTMAGNLGDNPTGRGQYNGGGSGGGGGMPMGGGGKGGGSGGGGGMQTPIQPPMQQFDPYNFQPMMNAFDTGVTDGTVSTKVPGGK